MTRKMQPTPAQRRVLEAIVAGGWLERAHRGNVWDHFPTNLLTVVQASTVNAMWRAGWLVVTGDRANAITALGRDALTQTPTARLSVREIGREAE